MAKFQLNMQNPIIFALFIASIAVALLSFTAVANVFFAHIPLVLTAIIYLLLIILLGLIYNQKYNEKLTRDFIIKTALYSSLFILLLIPVLIILTWLILMFKITSGEILFVLIGAIAIVIYSSVVSFIAVYSNLNFSNIIFSGRSL